MQREIMSLTGSWSSPRRRFNSPTPWRAPLAALRAARQAASRSAEVKIASVPSPISLSTSPPLAWIAEMTTSA
jgi:hypothetical protein